MLLSDHHSYIPEAYALFFFNNWFLGCILYLEVFFAMATSNLLALVLRPRSGISEFATWNTLTEQ